MTAILVNPVVIPYGGSVHLTPRDQNGNAIPIGQCTLLNLPSNIATSVKDATGFVITAVAVGSYPSVAIRATDGVTTVNSAVFTVTVSAPPYGVTEVGSSVP